MKIPLPTKLIDRYLRWYAPIGDWINVPIYKRVRRIDIVLVILGVACTAYYGFASGWQGALMGGLMYIFVIMLAAWLF